MAPPKNIVREYEILVRSFPKAQIMYNKNNSQFFVSIFPVCLLKKKSKINLGRTASEIKTTVGAKAHELLCYIKPQNAVSKLILKPFMQFLQPTEWIPRNPFKEE